ncbi:MAG: ATP-binding protein [Anaerolineae bacterium]|nr:ATP-binding protein [Anaerolineae bacterium]
MRILNEAIQVIIQAPGDLVYFLVALFALQQAFVSALSARSGTPKASLARRWVWVSGGMLLARAILVVLGLAGVAGLVAPSNILPPLERWSLFATVVGLIWVGILDVRYNHWRTPLVRGLLFGLLATTLCFYGYHAVAPTAAGTFFGITGGAVLVEMVAILLVLVVALGLAAYIRPLEWEWGLGVALFWFVGTLAQIGWPDPSTAIDGWLRLFSLVSLPLLSIWVHRQLLPSPVRLAPPGWLFEARSLIELLQTVGASPDLESSLIVASSRLAALMQVNICAVALTAKDAEGAVQVIAIHPPTAAQPAPSQLPLAAYAGLQLAFEERRIVLASLPDDDSWLTPLYSALGFETVLPLAVLPLQEAGQMLGLLLLGGPQEMPVWRSSDMATPLFVSGQLAGAITSARSVVAVPAGSGDGEARATEGAVPVAADAGQLGGETDKDRQRLVEALEQARVQFQALNSRIRSLMQEIKSRDEEILALNKELETRDHGISETELSIWQGEVRQMAHEHEGLDLTIKELTEDRDLLLSERTRLSEALSESKQALEQMEEHRGRLEEEVLSFKARLEMAEAEPTTLVPDPLDRLVAQNTGATYAGPLGLVIADEDGQMTMADAISRQMLRLPEGDVSGLPVDNLFSDPRWSSGIDDLLAPSDRGGLNRLRLTLSPDDDTVIEADLVSLRGRDDDVDGLVIMLRSSQSEVERHETLVSLVSDFRTPMTAITGYTDLLLGEQGGILTEMQQQFLERVKANVEQLTHLLNDLIRIASPDSRLVKFLPQPISLIEIIEEAIMGLAARFRERRLAVQLDLPPELALVRADRDSLYQIMLRLLSNAVLCSEEGTQIVLNAHEVSHFEEGRYLQISVTDTGPGILPEDYPRVFRKLYRANQPLVQGLGESGVGMAIAKALVEANGGRIWVESEEGVGSTLSFLLPCETEVQAQGD